jgi:hypothetical protein
VIPALTAAHTATTLRQIQNYGQTCSLELIAKNAIHGRNQRVRHALKLKRDAIDSELLGIEHVRLGSNRTGAVLSLGGSQRESEFLAQTRRHRRQRNGRGGGPGLNEREFSAH